MATARPAPMPLSPSRGVRAAAAVCLALTLLGQGLLFRHFCRTQIVPAYPRGYDQTTYLATAYDLYETLREHGVRSAIDSVRAIEAPQGVLLQVEAAIAQRIEGPGRLAALDLNFAYLALFEIALLALACWVQRPALGLALCGLLVSARSLYHDVGGMPDFRLDFAAFCLFGALICVAVRSSLFLRARWAVVFGIGMGVLLLTRTIYAAYLAPGLLVLAGLMVLWRKRDPQATRARLVNLALASAIAAALVVPSLIQRWHAIDAYYLTGHRSGEALVRASEFGVATSADSLSFYARSAIGGHAGPVFAVLALLICATLFGRGPAAPDAGEAGKASAAASAPAAAADHIRLAPIGARLGLGWLAATAATIYVVLTADVSKSPVVGAVFLSMAIPAVLIWAALPRTPREAGVWRIAILLFVFVAGQTFYAEHMLRRGVVPVDGADVREYGRLIDTIARLSQHLDRRSPVVSFDAVTEFTHVGVLRVLAFERLGIHLTPAAALGNIDIGLAPITAAAADQLLQASDFAVLGIDRDPHGAELYPVNASLRLLSPHLYEKADREMTRVADAAFFGRHVTLFMKPAIHCAGGARHPSLTHAGLECSTAGAVLAARPIVRLAGIAEGADLPDASAIQATVTQPRQAGQSEQTGQPAPAGQDTATVRCTLAVQPPTPTPTQTPTPALPVASRRYVIDCDTRGLRFAPTEPATLHISFAQVSPLPSGVQNHDAPVGLAWPGTIEALPIPLPPSSAWP